MEKRRTGAQDAAKGLMIISVIFFHCYMITFPNHIESIQSFNVLMAMFPFLLSAFFFYTGYNYTPNERTYKENIIRRAKQLLIPMVFAFFISSILLSVLELSFNHNDPVGTLTAIGNSLLYSLMSEPVALMTQFPQSHPVVFEIILSLGLLWFLYSLFVCSIFFYLLVKFTNKKLSTLISVVLALLVLAFVLGQYVGVYLPYTVQCYPVILAIMLTAAYLRQSHFLNRKITCKKDSILIGLNMLIAEGLVVGTCLVCYYKFGATTTGSLPGGKFDDTLKGFDAFIAYGFGILGTYFVHTLCRMIKHVPILGKCLQWIGNRSAVFYLFHPIFLDLLAIVIFQKQVPWGRGQAYFYVFAILGLMTLVLLLVSLINKIKAKRQIVEEIRNNEAPEDI